MLLPIAAGGTLAATAYLAATLPARNRGLDERIRLSDRFFDLAHAVMHDFDRASADDASANRNAQDVEDLLMLAAEMSNHRLAPYAFLLRKRGAQSEESERMLAALGSADARASKHAHAALAASALRMSHMAFLTGRVLRAGTLSDADGHGERGMNQQTRDEYVAWLCQTRLRKRGRVTQAAREVPA